MTGREVTLEYLLRDSPLMTHLLNASTTPDTLRALLQVAVVKNPSKGLQIFLDPNVRSAICNNQSQSALKNYLDLPSDFNVAGLFKAICAFDPNTLQREALQLITANLAEKVNQIMLMNTNKSANWTQIFLNSRKLVEDFQKLLQNAPTFKLPNMNLTQFNEILLKFSQSMNFMDGNTYTPIIESLVNLLRTYAPREWREMENNLKIQKATMEWLNSFMSMADLDTKGIRLEKLFQNTTAVRNILAASLNLGPDYINTWLAIIMKPEKVRFLIVLLCKTLLNKAGNYQDNARILLTFSLRSSRFSWSYND